MELAKLRAQAYDSKSQRASSDVRIEVLELKRQLLGRETMLGHEREVADRRLEAVRRESSLLTERLDLSLRERDWAMQELHAARSDERLALSRSRALAEEGTGLRSRCDALEGAHQHIQQELEAVRGNKPIGLQQSIHPLSGTLGGLSLGMPSPVQPVSMFAEDRSPTGAFSPAASPSAQNILGRTVDAFGGQGRLMRNGRASSISSRGTLVPAEAWAHPAQPQTMPIRQKSTPMLRGHAATDPVGGFGMPVLGFTSTFQVPPGVGIPVPQVRTPRGGSSPATAARPTAKELSTGSLTGGLSSPSYPMDPARRLQSSVPGVPVVRRMVAQKSAGNLSDVFLQRQEAGRALSPTLARPPGAARGISPRPDQRWS